MNMLKGVNRQIVEINNTDSIYFEKAILYVKPAMHEISPYVLAQEAQHYVSEYIPLKKRKRKWALALVASTIGGAFLGIAFAVAWKLLSQ